MLSYQEQIEEFERSFSSVIDKDVIDLSRTFDTLFYEKNSNPILPTIETAKSMLSKDFNIPTKMQINYNIANGYHDLRVIENINDETYLEKELYYLRNALDMYENHFCDDDSTNDTEMRVAKYIAKRSYTNLGNAYRVLGESPEKNV